MSSRRTKTTWFGAFAPWGFFALKVLVSIYALHAYIPRYIRLTYIADGPARGIEAYNLAFGDFGVFQTYQFLPLQLWLWAGLLKIYPDIYWTGTALNIAAAAGTTALLYLLGRELAGPVAGSFAAVLFIFSPVHHNVTLSEGMADSLFFFWTAAGVYAASRAAAGRRGAAAAGFLFAAAALTRYEGALPLILYAAYRPFRSRPRGVAGWLLWGAPPALAGVLLGHKAFAVGGGGIWPLMPALKADMANVLTNLHWYRRTYYGLERLWLDGRVAAAFGVLGAVLVWRRHIRNESRLLIWGGAVTLFVGLTVLVVAVGCGLCPERYFSIVLLLLFPFAGLAAVEIWRRASGRALKITVSILFAAAAAYTAYFDAAIKDYGYGYPGPCYTCHTLEAELALKLRDLWRRGELGPDDIIYMEENTDNYSNYSVRAYSNHPLNFYVCPAGEIEDDLWYLKYILQRNKIRVAIFVNGKTRRHIKPFYRAYKKFAVIYENPGHTIVVRRAPWSEGVPDFSSAIVPEECRVIRK
ncbi:MAG TPA: glycosyltransferase family 39 protein [bacterium]|nr:glycosyltransferase family 39 protein [bacterium]